MEKIYPPGAAKPGGPYTPAIQAGDLIFVSGQIPVDRVSNQLIHGGIQEETRQCLENIEAILAGAGASRNDVVRCGVFLKDGKDFGAMNEAYIAFFGEHRPARTTVEVKFARPDMLIEIDAVAQKPR